MVFWTYCWQPRWVSHPEERVDWDAPVQRLLSSETGIYSWLGYRSQRTAIRPWIDVQPERPEWHRLLRALQRQRHWHPVLVVPSWIHLPFAQAGDLMRWMQGIDQQGVTLLSLRELWYSWTPEARLAIAWFPAFEALDDWA